MTEKTIGADRKRARIFNTNKLKYLFLITLPFLAICQDSLNNEQLENKSFIEEFGEHKYVSLKKHRVYDVEIIVFAYLNPLPNYKTFKNKAIFDDSSALVLKNKPKNLPYIQQQAAIKPYESDNLNPTGAETDYPELTVSIEVEEENKLALAWFEHEPDKYKLTPIWKKLVQQQTIVPLIHKAWRQTETPFENPIYVKISSLLTDKTASENNINNELAELSESRSTKENIEISNSEFNIYSDFTVTGMVALSHGRFMHFGNRLNLFRLYNAERPESDIENMVLSLVERRQIKTNELHYFDSPWFGSIVKVTRYTGDK